MKDMIGYVSRGTVVWEYEGSEWQQKDLLAQGQNSEESEDLIEPEPELEPEPEPEPEEVLEETEENGTGFSHGAKTTIVEELNKILNQQKQKDALVFQSKNEDGSIDVDQLFKDAGIRKPWESQKYLGRINIVKGIWYLIDGLAAIGLFSLLYQLISGNWNFLLAGLDFVYLAGFGYLLYWGETKVTAPFVKIPLYRGQPFSIWEPGHWFFKLPPVIMTVEENLPPVDSDLRVSLLVEENNPIPIIGDMITKLNIEVAFRIKNPLMAYLKKTVTGEYKRYFAKAGDIVYDYDIQAVVENICDSVVFRLLNQRTFDELVSVPIIKVDEYNLDTGEPTGKKIWVNALEKLAELLIDAALKVYGIDVTMVKLTGFTPTETTQKGMSEIQAEILATDKQKQTTKKKIEEVKTAEKEAERVNTEQKGKGTGLGNRLQQITENGGLSPDAAAELVKMQMLTESVNPNLTLIMNQGESKGKGGNIAETAAIAGAVAANTKLRQVQPAKQEEKPTEEPKQENKSQEAGQGKKKKI